MTGQYRATWVSDEIAGESSNPNILTYFAANDVNGLALSGAIDALISGDLTSCVNVIGGDPTRSTYPVAGGGSEGMQMCDADDICEHIAFKGVHFGVKAALQGLIQDHPGMLKLFRTGTAVTYFKGAKR
jgi:hypothetical protein